MLQGLGHIVAVTNNDAGYSLPLLDTNVDEARKLFDVNVFGVIAVTQAFTPLLMASKGTVINIGSIAGMIPMYWNGYYNASKAAINLLTDNLRLELAPFHIKVILVVTGGVHSRFFENQPSITLPDNSYYAPAREEIEFAAGGGVVDSSKMNVDTYAGRVVKNALKRNPTTHQYAGGNSTMMWIILTFVWRPIWVSKDVLIHIFFMLI